jgi:hypothetical protein
VLRLPRAGPSLIPRLDLRARLEVFRRMDDDLVADGQAGADLGFVLAAVAHFDGPELGATIPDAENGPALPLSEEGASGRLDHVASLPRDDPHFDPAAVAQRAIESTVTGHWIPRPAASG